MRGIEGSDAATSSKCARTFSGKQAPASARKRPQKGETLRLTEKRKMEQRGQCLNRRAHSQDLWDQSPTDPPVRRRVVKVAPSEKGTFDFVGLGAGRIPLTKEKKLISGGGYLGWKDSHLKKLREGNKEDHRARLGRRLYIMNPRATHSVDDRRRNDPEIINLRNSLCEGMEPRNGKRRAEVGKGRRFLHRKNAGKQNL